MREIGAMAVPFVTTLDDSAFTRGLRNMERGADKAAKSIGSSLKTAGAGIGASIAASFSVGAITSAASAILKFTGDIQDQSDAVGIDVEKLQGLQAVFLSAGVNSEKFTTGLAKLNSATQDAKDGAGAARDSFEKLGIRWESLANSSPDRVLMMIADGLKNAEDPAKAFAAALDIVGSKNYKMVAALKQGSEEILKQSESTKKLTEAQVALLATAGDNLEAMITTAKVMGAQGVVKVYEYRDALTALASTMVVAGGQGGILADALFWVNKALEGKPAEQFGPPMPGAQKPADLYGPSAPTEKEAKESAAAAFAAESERQKKETKEALDYHDALMNVAKQRRDMALDSMTLGQKAVALAKEQADIARRYRNAPEMEKLKLQKESLDALKKQLEVQRKQREEEEKRNKEQYGPTWQELMMSGASASATRSMRGPNEGLRTGSLSGRGWLGGGAYKSYGDPSNAYGLIRRGDSEKKKQEMLLARIATALDGKGG